MVNDGILTRIGERLTSAGGGYTATDMLQKLNTMVGLSHGNTYGGMNDPSPPYQRHFSPLWLYKLRRDSSLINNACDKKIKQVFRQGWTDWQKEYTAKCPMCEKEFQGYDEFRNQMGEHGDDLEEEDFDFETKRTCPECGEYVQMLTPERSVRENAQEFFDRANSQGGDVGDRLEPHDQSSVSQSLLNVFKELAWDLESFDDAWLIFDRSYYLDDDGSIVDYELEEVFRAPPELMRYSVDEETNEPGGEYWVCVRCRANNPDNYQPEEDDQPCTDCGGTTYQAYAYAMETPDGKEDEYFIRGEFAHDSLYETKRFYGYSPILSLWEEARTLEQMDSWYHDAYEERRAPRGAITVNAARDEELRQLNYQQMEKLRQDPNYIPFFMNDQETEGEPIQFVELLSDPAEMQHMEMRDWFQERISAKYGVTHILQTGSPENSGLSQSMEVEVSQKAAENLRDVFHETFLPAILAQLGTEGWTRKLEPAIEEDEQEEAQLVGQHLNNAQKALQIGAEVEWTEEGRAEIKQGELENPEDEMEGMMGGGAMPGGAPQGAGDMMGMEGGIEGERGPDPHSLEPGEDQEVDEAGERTEGPNDEDRPAAQPLKSMSTPDRDELEKIASDAFSLERKSTSEEIGERV
jgi:hypothetical protein